ncbi:cysteine desulfurase family protein [Geobacillus subterraneus]|uniref:cysteine desulfurase family protein n=1 Tax=Geobacillus subterraneus TaxID=129338 RepID=UPI002AC8C1F6|nr:cysteine desulfurase family protein [Geobacillus subterraneus]WPZ17710.1 cysteine desulfurase family protein [Geobacillus subterraneus]
MIYLDNSATTKPFPEVIDSFVTVATDYFANPSSLHELGMKAERLLAQAREQIAAMLRVKANEVVFTSGGTEANNFAMKGVAWQYRRRGRHIITTEIEHPSVAEPCRQLEELGFEVTYLPVDRDGRVSVEQVERALRDDTILVSIMHVNNEVGTVQPIEEIGALLARYPKTLFHVDRVQGIGKVPLDLKQAGVDLCTLSAHKFHGLRGAGVLYVREGVRLMPLIAGGGQEMRLRSGTENVAAIVAMAKALRLAMEKYEREIGRLKALKEEWLAALSAIPEIEINTPRHGAAPHIINFSLKRGMKPEVFVHELAKSRIYVSTTSACSSKKKAPSQTLLAMGLGEGRAERGIRISLSFDNTSEEIAPAVAAMKQAIKTLSEVTGSHGDEV